MGLVPAATYGNKKAINGVSVNTELEDFWSDICFDPQTSGGLLLAMPEEDGRKYILEAHSKGLAFAACVRKVLENGGYDVYVK